MTAQRELRFWVGVADSDWGKGRDWEAPRVAAWGVIAGEDE